MTIVLRIALIIVSILTCCYVLRRIKKAQMLIEDSIFWIGISFVLVLISIFPQIADMMSSILGVGATVNFVFLAIIFILLLKVFLMSIRISQLEDRLRTLVQKISIKDYDVEQKIDSIDEK